MATGAVPNKKARKGFPGGPVTQNLPANAGYTSSLLGSGGAHPPQGN